MFISKNILSISLITVALCASCSSSKQSGGSSKRLPGTWQAQPIVVDGKNNDWPAQYPDYDMKAAVGYAISNDKDNLYITVETGDRTTQLKILKEGLVVWIDKTGEKEQNLSLNFPSAGPNDNNETESDRPEPQYVQQVQDPETREKYQLEDKVNAALAKAQYYFLNGFKTCRGRFSFSVPDTCGIEVRAAVDDMNELVWEAKIPFKTFYYKQTIDRRDRGKELSIGFDIQGLKRPPGQQNNGTHSGGMRPSVGFGMGGPGMGFNMGGGGMHNGGQHRDNASEQLYKSTLTWKKTGIAYEDAK